MSIGFRFAFAAGLFFGLAALRSMAIYAALSVALNDGIAWGLQLPRGGLRAPHKGDRSYP